MLVIGSAALAVAGIGDKIPNDLDVIVWKEEIEDVVKTFKPAKVDVLDDHRIVLHGCRDSLSSLLKTQQPIVELEIAWPGSSAEKILLSHKMDEYWGFWVFMKPVDCYWLKMSHRYKKNTPHFEKTRNDILALRKVFKLSTSASLSKSFVPRVPHWYKQREEETYNYGLPNLQPGQTKDKFFSGGGVKYYYDHDWIHEVVARMYNATAPAYTLYLKEGETVACDRGRFDSLPQEEKLRGVMEEATVLALERSIIPSRKDEDWVARGVQVDSTAIWKYALQKVCTSITSGWFREFAWEQYDNALQSYNRNYADIFWSEVKDGSVLVDAS
jgi:hypothetical protein